MDAVGCAHGNLTALMLGPLILIGVIVLIVGVPLTAILWVSKRRPGQTDLVLLAAAAGEAELELWKRTLRRHAISYHIVSL